MLTPQIIDDVVARALAEDAPWGDITSELLIPADARIDAVLSAREPGVLSGGPVIVAAMRAVDPSIRVALTRDDGARFDTGDTLATIEGPARGVLRAERVALNLAQRMSGIATLTARYVDAVAGTGARIVDTRKTTPGLRALERAAVRAGGGFNHRFSLSDAVLAKDNHLAVLAAQHGGDLTAAIRSVRARLSHTTHLEVEVDRVDQIEPVVSAGVDTILLDNFSLEELREGVAIVAGRALVDASGGVDLTTVAGIAATGVDLISVGALTHSVRALDLGLDAVLRP
ncbi:carboxylating nicotinate-nucleotide diphosphorylase [Herbiconiux sp. KACC 21604]|uniref:carboxylating nicotinate-nucleotide diphosphorylase n=1 Tax=unclassified Herbiconiux TaxID=2618217 RepID=UPI001492FC3A|nr:carboxylating nicotinate-nucleotide diphosphorylase [Herbiconiux sp. SALV-R1]QJU55268.1 carboxylating nicotinate-nucleotide diphosphorylase [Herbiconiux sp. SALV-R1]WPO86435.1 carboxylating nicotinate-nucleotide diphosphorylase [Herbiconiux sp. KACC 21604]